MFRRLCLLLHLLVLISVFTITNASASNLKYQPVSTFSTGAATPNAFAVGDFNGDGKPDLAVPDQFGKTVSIYLNDGLGNFGNPIVTTLTIDNTLGSILAGDVNEDGKTDLVVATVAGDQFAIVLLGNGDGSFTPQPPVADSFGFLSGKIADLNGDGHVDLFLGGNGEPNLFLGKGDGTFSQQAVPNGSFPGDYTSVAVGDFNGDKHLDAVATDASDPGNVAGSLDFFPGDGMGAFGAPTFFHPVPVPNPESVDAADFNHDGKLDLLLGGNSGAFIAFGNGDGTFQLGTDQVISLVDAFFEPGISNPDFYSAVTADLDHDGNPDGVIVDGTTGLVTLVLNDGSGTFPNAFNTPYTFQLAANSYYIATADFNGDGLPDIVVSNQKTKTMSLILSAKSLVSPTINFTTSNNSALVGTPLILSAKVTGGTSIPSGTVSLLDGNSQLAQQALDASGSVAFNISSLTTGVHSLSLNYSGDSNFAPANSAAISQSVTDFQVALAPATQTIAAGSTATYTLTLTPEGGFTGSVTVACSGLPNLAKCPTTPISISGGPATETITLTTTASMSAMADHAEGVFYAYTIFGGLSFCCLIRRKNRVRIGSLCIFGICSLLALATGTIACGGGSKSVVPGTPSGTSTITITATATQNDISVSHNATGALIVQ